MNTESFLQEIMLAGTELWVAGGRLEVREPQAGLAAEQRAYLAQATDQIVQTLPGYSFDAPLAYGQEALWLVQQANADSLAYNTATLLHLHTAVATEVWRPLLQRLVQRHAALRTTFALREHLPVQVIHAMQPVQIETIDCRGQSWDAVMAAVEQAVWRPFDLERGPLFRVFLFTQSPTSQLLLLSSHHIINDGFSQWMLIDELLTLYAQVQSAEEGDLTPLQYTYPKFVEKERALIAEKGAEWRAWWQETLAGELPVLDLPTDYPRQPRTNGQAASVPLRLPAALRDQMRLLARAAGVSFYSVLLAGLQVLLHRYSGQDEIIVGVPTAGRQKEYGQTFGDFINPVPVRGRLANVPFLEFLQQIRSQLTAAIAHRDYPFSLLVQQFPGVRGSGRTPIFQTALIAQQIRDLGDKAIRLLSGEHLPVADLTCAFIGWWPGGGDVDLTVDLMERHDGLFGYIRYNPELFTPATITRLGDHYHQLLTTLVADPTQRIDEAPLLTPAERREILVDWNNTSLPYPQDRGIHHLIEEQAAQHPDAVAVVFPSNKVTTDHPVTLSPCHPVTLSYGDLNHRANQVAHHLQSLGVGAETLVGIYLERTPLVFVALLGVLKAGAAYLPLDPTYPQQRIAHMLADAQAPLLLTTSALAASLPEQGAQVVLLDEAAPVWQAATTNLNLSIPLERLAYVIYTSGSTGQPKGAMVTHGNFVNAYRGWEASYDLAHCRAHLQMASFSFDVFGGDMVRALCSGAKLVICPREWLLEADQLYGLMRREGVECAEFVPAVLRNLVDYLERTGQDLAFMRLVIAGSDLWYGEEYRRLLRFCGPQTRLINSYGITETTIDSTFFELTPAMDRAATLADGALVPIGRPFANVRLYVLDQQRQPVPLGVAGDLYIGGDGVSRGYLNRPELTASRFLTLAIEGRPERLYYTGDRARWMPTPDGPPNLAFLGRADNQVKLRGYRIELGEIESALAAHPSVQQAVVMVRNDGGQVARLVAYVVPQPSATVNGYHNGNGTTDHSTTLSAALRSHLQQKLPDYMVPAAIVILAALPLTPNGKVDRRALPAPDSAAMTTRHLPPRTATEIGLAQIWQEVLGLRQVGIDDNFFDAGGHSLLALQVINRSRAAFGVGLTLRNLFDSPTIAALAEQIEQLMVVQALQHPIEVETEELREEIAL